jgi:oligogalacturonide lyase
VGGGCGDGAIYPNRIGSGGGKGTGPAERSHDGKSATVSFKSGEKSWEIGVIDLSSGAYRRVLEQGFQIGHVQHSPAAPLIFYTWETSGYAPQRTWLVNADGTGNRPFYAAIDPKKWVTPLKEWITHEAWVPGTSDMTMIFDKVGILRVTPDGESQMVVRGNYWHAQATLNGKQLIADDFDGRVWLIEAATGETRLIATGLRRPGEPHIHPSIDPTGKWVVVNTVREGRPSVAVLNLCP